VALNQINFNVQPIVSTNRGASALNTVYTNSLTTAAARDVYTFTLAQDTLVSIDTQFDSFNVMCSLTGAAGQSSLTDISRAIRANT